jgi:hypothetical protein
MLVHPSPASAALNSFSSMQSVVIESVQFCRAALMAGEECLAEHVFGPPSLRQSALPRQLVAEQFLARVAQFLGKEFPHGL